MQYCYVYVLEFDGLGYYIGCSSNVYRRIMEHKYRIAAYSSIVGYLGCFSFVTRKEALRAEALLQKIGNAGFLTDALDMLEDLLIRDWPPPNCNLKTPYRRMLWTGAE